MARRETKTQLSSADHIGDEADASVTPPQGYIEDVQRERGAAVVAAAKGTIALSHLTAGAFHGLPLIDVWDERVHTTPFGDSPPTSRGRVVRHNQPLSARDLTKINGVLVTSLDRTVFDLIRTMPFAAALAVMDAALHLIAFDPVTRTVDEKASEGFRTLVRIRVVEGYGWRGIRQARLVAELGDAWVESPAESRGHARMWQLGMPMPLRQVKVETRLGEVWPDDAWPDLGRFGECDGAVKLTDARMLAGRTAEQVRAHQADRRAAIAEATGWSGMHWGWGETTNPQTFWKAMLDQGWDPSWCSDKRDTGIGPWDEEWFGCAASPHAVSRDWGERGRRKLSTGFGQDLLH